MKESPPDSETIDNTLHHEPEYLEEFHHHIQFTSIGNGYTNRNIELPRGPQRSKTYSSGIQRRTDKIGRLLEKHGINTTTP